MGSQWFKFPNIKCSLHCFDQCSLFKGLLGVERGGDLNMCFYIIFCAFFGQA